MLQVACQWLMVVQLVVLFFGMVHTDFNGSSGKKPLGFSGFIGTCVVIAILSAVWYGAGVFSALVP